MKAIVDILGERLGDLKPRHALILGSGLGSLVDAVADPVRIPYGDLPGFPQSAVSGHAGEFVGGRISGTPVLIMSDEGFSARAGGDGDTSTLMGPGVDLLWWLARGVDSPAISGLNTERGDESSTE